VRRRIGDTSAALFRCIIPNLTAPCSFNASLASHLCLALTQCAAPLPDAFPIVAGTLFSVTFQRPTYCSTLHLRTLWPSPHARPLVSRFSSATLLLSRDCAHRHTKRLLRTCLQLSSLPSCCSVRMPLDFLQSMHGREVWESDADMTFSACYSMNLALLNHF